MMDNGYGYGYDHGGNHWAGLIIMIVAAVVLSGALTWIIVTLRHQRAVPSPGEFGTGGSPAPSALLILDERFARGEIDAEEYQSRRDRLHRKE